MKTKTVEMHANGVIVKQSLNQNFHWLFVDQAFVIVIFAVNRLMREDLIT